MTKVRIADVLEISLCQCPVYFGLYCTLTNQALKMHPIHLGSSKWTNTLPFSMADLKENYRFWNTIWYYNDLVITLFNWGNIMGKKLETSAKPNCLNSYMNIHLRLTSVFCCILFPLTIFQKWNILIDLPKNTFKKKSIHITAETNIYFQAKIDYCYHIFITHYRKELQITFFNTCKSMGKKISKSPLNTWITKYAKFPKVSSAIHI